MTEPSWRCAKIDADYDAHDRVGAVAFLTKHAAKGPDRHRACSTSIRIPKTFTPISTRWETPLNALDEKALCPGSAALDKINASLR